MHPLICCVLLFIVAQCVRYPGNEEYSPSFQETVDFEKERRETKEVYKKQQNIKRPRKKQRVDIKKNMKTTL